LLFTFPFTVNVFDIVGLNFGAIKQHKRRQIARRGSRIDGTAKTAANQRRQVTAVIDVGVRQDHRVNGLGVKGKLTVLFECDLSLALVEPTVQQHLFAGNVNQVHRSGDRLGGTPELNFH